MILIIYGSEVFKEYLLPGNQNTDYIITLYKNLFRLHEDIIISLDGTDKGWKVKPSREYGVAAFGGKQFDGYLKDGAILYFTTKHGESVQGIVTEAHISYQALRKYDISDLSRLWIGKDEHADISYQFMELVSKNHACIVKQVDGYYIEDLSSNGIFSASVRIHGKKRLEFGESMNIFGLHLIFLGQVLAIGNRYGELSVKPELSRLHIIHENRNTGNTPDFLEKKYFNRAPRNLPNIYSETIEIEAPPPPKITKQKPLFLTIGPAFTMAIPMMLGCSLAIFSTRAAGRSSSAFMYTGIVTAVASAVIGVIWALVNLKYAKQTESEEEKQRFNAYGNYLIRIADFLKEKYIQNTNALCSMFPSAGDCCTYNDKNPCLWNRNSSHKDFLYERLGTGDIPFQADILIPKEKFTMINDSLQKKPGMIKEEFKILKDVPIGIDLSEKRLWGVIGGKEKRGAIAFMHSLVSQITVHNCYTDVKMCFIYEGKTEQDKKDWSFAKWLPHVWSEDRTTRFVASNTLEAGDIFYELSNVIRIRAEQKDSFSHKKAAKPQYVLFLSDISLLEGELIAKYILDPKEEYGLITFIMAEGYQHLPNACENIIQNNQYFTGIYNAMDADSQKQKIMFDFVTSEQLERLARSLSGVRVNELESNSDIPASLEFLEMYQVHSLKELHVLERWRKNRTYQTMRALIGKKSGGNDCYLDVHEKYHGPHGLLAGTTGSGKSETLQTYMLSLALNFSPDDVGFFIIDFKGGGMANLFSDLPHTLGQISNLSGNQVRRAMISIKSENIRRQKIFNEHGVNNINLYTRLQKNKEAAIPIPHLFIIIDEFAELKKEEPEFMRELISVAQVGRSLGVHLILATQKPSGTVDDNIWSNSKFRLCLRVQDRQDSNDMLHKPDAAFITQAGRCYLQVGSDEIYELFQSGWSGAVYDDSIDGGKEAIATMLTLTGKTAIIGSRAKIKRKEREKLKWYCCLVEAVLKAAEELELIPEHILNPSYEMTCMTAKICEFLKKQEVDYPNTKSNILRIETLISLWEAQEMSVEERAKAMMQRADMENLKMPEVKEKTQLDAIVEYLKKLALENGYMNNLKLWMPVLPKRLLLAELAGYKENSFDGSGWKQKKEEIWSLSAVIGKYDDPVNQSQMPLSINFADHGHHAICGTVVSGKSIFLQTLVYSLVTRYTPDHINIYALDFSSRMLSAFESLAHVGGIVYENQEEKLDKLFHMLRSIMKERKKLLGGGNYSQYVQVHGVVLPSIVIIIDNFANFKEKTNNKHEEILIQISREGVGYGIYLVITSGGFGTSEIQSKIGDNMRTVLCLEMGDKFKYAEVLRVARIEVLPEADIKGRGLVQVGGSFLEFQTALSVEANDDYERLEAINRICVQMNHAWKGRPAKSIPEIPEEPVMSEFVELEAYKRSAEHKDWLPTAYKIEDASIHSIHLSRTYCYTIIGKERTGKTNLLKLILYAASLKKGQLCMIEQESCELEQLSKEYNAAYLKTGQDLFEYFKALLPVFAQRNKKKQSLLAQGKNDMEIYEEMCTEPPIFIFIANLVTFVECAYHREQGVGDIQGFLENVIGKGFLHHIYFFGVLETGQIAKIAGTKLYNSFVSYKTGTILGGNVGGQRIFSFNNITFTEINKVFKKGIGLTPEEEDDSQAEKIIIPLAGR